MTAPHKETLADDVDIWLGDCRDVLPLIGRVDAVVTDPPYGINFKYESHDDNPEEYQELMSEVIKLCDSLVHEGPFFFWQAIKTASKWHLWFPDGYRIMASCKNFTQFRPISIQFGFDPIIYWRKGRDFPGQAGIRDWHIANTAAFICGEKWGHPCPRPIDAVEWVIGSGVVRDALVLDPFMGSGTTGVACVNLGRSFIGIEREPKYYDIARRRITEALSKPRLPFDEPVKPKQESLL